MAMCAMDKWGSRVLKLEKPEQIRDHWNTDEASQFIWVDDASGAMQYEADLVMEWNRILPALSTMIRAGHQVVLTSRDYIYNSARPDLKRTAFPLIEEKGRPVFVQRLDVMPHVMKGLFDVWFHQDWMIAPGMAFRGTRSGDENAVQSCCQQA